MKEECILFAEWIVKKSNGSGCPTTTSNIYQWNINGVWYTTEEAYDFFKETEK